MPFYPNEIKYSDKYKADKFEYIHVLLPKSYLPKLTGNLLSEKEWKSFGIKLSSGWENYLIFAPEPHVILFRRKK